MTVNGCGRTAAAAGLRARAVQRLTKVFRSSRARFVCFTNLAWDLAFERLGRASLRRRTDYRQIYCNDTCVHTRDCRTGTAGKRTSNLSSAVIDTRDEIRKTYCLTCAHYGDMVDC